MASTKAFIPHVPSKGVDQSAQSFTLDVASSRYLLNFRPEKNQLIQTPLFLKYATLTALGGTSPGAVRLITSLLNLAGNLHYFVLDEATARFVDPSNPSTQIAIPFVLQTTCPTNPAIQGQVLLYGISALDFSTLADEFEVTIVDGTHFKWRKNAGSWSADLVIANATNIGVGMYLGFLSTSGFNPGDTWKWKRVASPYTGLYPSYAVTTHPYRKDCYIAGYDRHILRLRNDTLTSVGYKRVYGKYVGVFYNHLVVGQFAEGTYDAVTGIKDTYDVSTTPWRLAWSDRDNPDNFFATDLNEADGKTLANAQPDDGTALGITGMAGLRTQFYIYLGNEIYVMTYVGLPNVMQVESLNLHIGSAFQNGLVATPDGHFFISKDNICRFDGTSVTRIGHKVRDLLFAELPPKTDTERQKLFGFYDEEKLEIVWTYPYRVNGSYYISRQLIYQLETGEFYFRNAPHASMSGGLTIRAIGPKINSFQELVYGGSGQALLLCDGLAADGANLSSNFIPDNINTSGVTSFTSPEIQTQDEIFEDAVHVKECEGLFLDANYDNGTGIEVSIAARDYASSPVFVAQSQIWTPTVKEGRLSFPKRAFRVIAYRFKGLGSLPSNFIIRAWGEFIYGIRQTIEK